MLMKKYVGDPCFRSTSCVVVDVAHWIQALTYDVSVGTEIDVGDMESGLLVNVPEEKRRLRLPVVVDWLAEVLRCVFSL